MTVYAIAEARTNAELIAQAAELGYLRADWCVLDPTYGLGRFWTRFRPAALLGTDLDPAKSPTGHPVDFRRLPYPRNMFDAVVLDPPYQLNGTSSGSGPSAKDSDYGVTEYASPDERHALICDGITECVRVLRAARRVRVDRGRSELDGGILLVKCQDQVCGGTVHWQTRIFAAHAEALGLVLEDQLHLPGYRAQPPRTRKHGDCNGTGCDACVDGRVPSRQEHAARNYSTLLVLRKPPERSATAQGSLL